MTDAATILERHKVHAEKTLKWRQYRLRLIAANYIDLSGAGTSASPKRGDGQFPKVSRQNFEEGVHSSIAVNTQIQAKSMLLGDPDIKWSECEASDPDLAETIAKVRRAYYLQRWREMMLAWNYSQCLLDLATVGERSSFWGVRDGRPFLEYGDCTDVTWDPVFDSPAMKRWVFRDRHLPLRELLKLYPSLESEFPASKGMASALEQTQTIACYYDRDTVGVVFRKKVVDGPKDSPYGGVPGRLDVLMQEPVLLHPTGLVEVQIGLQRLRSRLQRSYREQALRAVPVGLALGAWDEGDLDRVQAGEEGVILRSPTPSDTFQWVSGGKIEASHVDLDERLGQSQGEAAGVNDFQRGRTDTKVDFASQLAMIAEMSGTQGKFTQQVFETGVKDDARAYMGVSARFEDAPMKLRVGKTTQEFGPNFPVKVLLGTDGTIALGPMPYRTPAQKLQETAILGQVLTMAATLPEGLSEPFVDQALTAFEVDDKDVWLAAMKQAAEQRAQAEQQAQAAQMQAQGMGPGVQGMGPSGMMARNAQVPVGAQAPPAAYAGT